MFKHPLKLAAMAGVVGLTSAPALAATVTQNLNLRNGPGINATILTAMPAGAQITARACSNLWCRVDWGGFSGFASARYIDLTTSTAT